MNALCIACQLGMLIEAAGVDASSSMLSNVTPCMVCHMPLHYVDPLTMPGRIGHSGHLLSAHLHCIQVFNKLEVMFQVAIEQNSLRQQTQQQAAWLATASQQDIRACSPESSCSIDQDPTWSDLDYESWTLL